MGQDRNEVREKVTGKAGGLAAKAEAKAGGMGLSRKQVAEVKDEVRAKGGKAVESSVEGARQVAATGGKVVEGTVAGAGRVVTVALRNKVRAVATAAAAGIAAVWAGRRIVRRRKSS
jgi:hypothetical protein